MKLSTAIRRFEANKSHATAAVLMQLLTDAARTPDTDDHEFLTALQLVYGWLADPTAEEEKLTAVQRLTRDLMLASVTLTDTEARFLVDAYYTMQDNRIRHDGQVRSMERLQEKEPHMVLSWLAAQSENLENQVKHALDKYSAAHPDGVWLRSVVGIGPVISAGLLAHLSIEDAETVGHWWAFAGLDPTRKWLKGQKRPHNAELKVLCYKAGESFVKNSNRDGCVYGKYYQQRKVYENERNDTGYNAARCVEILKSKNYGKTTEAYKAYASGKFPPAHIHAMARRWAVKLFLAHLHEQMYIRVRGKAPPLPYPVAHLGHVDVIKP